MSVTPFDGLTPLGHTLTDTGIIARQSRQSVSNHNTHFHSPKAPVQERWSAARAGGRVRLVFAIARTPPAGSSRRSERSTATSRACANPFFLFRRRPAGPWTGRAAAEKWKWLDGVGGSRQSFAPATQGRRGRQRAVRQYGSHIRLEKTPDGTVRITVPAHKPVKRSTLSKILKQAEIRLETFLRAL